MHWVSCQLKREKYSNNMKDSIYLSSQWEYVPEGTWNGGYRFPIPTSVSPYKSLGITCLNEHFLNICIFHSIWSLSTSQRLLWCSANSTVICSKLRRKLVLLGFLKFALSPNFEISLVGKIRLHCSSINGKSIIEQFFRSLRNQWKAFQSCA